MFFVLQCGGIPFDGDTIKTKSLGGSETAAYYLAKELSEAGHRVVLFTNTAQSGIFDGVRYEPMGEVTKDTPLGQNFHLYATATPHDVCILQRHPSAFAYRWASKINLWWLHDLALYRSKGAVAGMQWNIDRILTVSEYHRDQVANVYGIDKNKIVSIRNGVGDEARDPSDPPAIVNTLLEQGKNILTYSSRPERGLEHLLRPGGIMDRLGEDYHLLFCGYENTTPAMADYYHALWQRAEEMPNVTNLGALTKQQLAGLMQSADMHIYPTEFEEVSCITAMECMVAGLPMITSEHAALPETCKDAGVELIPLVNGQANEDAFVEAVPQLIKNREAMALAQLEAGKEFTWKAVADRVQSVVYELFSRVSEGSIVADYYRNSDIMAINGMNPRDKGIAAAIKSEVANLYPWIYSTADLVKHYSGREEPLRRADVTQSPRFTHVYRVLESRLAGKGKTVIDYGCNAGHFTLPLAMAFPDHTFVGVDHDVKAVEFAAEWAKESGVKNVSYCTPDDLDVIECDTLIACEVLEHAPDIEEFWGCLPIAEHYIFTTPYGPWEWLSYEKMQGYREHVHHLERADLHDLFGHMQGFRVLNIPHSTHRLDLSLGSYVVEFDRSDKPVGKIDYSRKFGTQKPRQTVSACILVSSSEETILKMLRAVAPHVDELVLRFDEKCNEATHQVVNMFLNEFWDNSKSIIFLHGKSPMEIGFDAARNESVAVADGDWILWLDTDETITFRDGWEGLLKENLLEGFAIAQHHFSADPAAVIKVDYPCRLFRNNGAKFFGMVHEHPERALNKGIGHVQLTKLIEIQHYGYKCEDTRRGRFFRNFPLLEKDREKYPDRELGHMLWLRDCGQRIQFEMEQNGGNVTPELQAIARDGVETWERLVDSADMRMICDSLEFYSVCSQVLGHGIEAAMSIGISKIPNGMPDSLPTHKAVFYSQEHIQKLAMRLLNTGTDIDTRYL